MSLTPKLSLVVLMLVAVVRQVVVVAATVVAHKTTIQTPMMVGEWKPFLMMVVPQ